MAWMLIGCRVGVGVGVMVGVSVGSGVIVAVAAGGGRVAEGAGAVKVASTGSVAARSSGPPPTPGTAHPVTSSAKTTNQQILFRNNISIRQNLFEDRKTGRRDGQAHHVAVASRLNGELFAHLACLAGVQAGQHCAGWMLAGAQAHPGGAGVVGVGIDRQQDILVIEKCATRPPARACGCP